MTTWHEIHDPQDPELDRLAAEYKLHPLHVEDCRQQDQNAKVEQLNDYIFVVLKVINVDEDCVIDMGDLDIFVGPSYVITVHEKKCSVLEEGLTRLRGNEGTMRPDQLFYKVIDWTVDSYLPALDKMSDRIDEMEDQALTDSSPSMLQGIFTMKRALIQLRRMLANERDVVGHLLRNEFPQLKPDLNPFFRDVYDHLVRNLDVVEVYRDLLSGATDLYLSSVANRTNQVMKVLTIFGTLATPALVITGMYGMNVKHLPFAEHPHAFGIVMALMLSLSAVLIVILKRFDWI